MTKSAKTIRTVVAAAIAAAAVLSAVAVPAQAGYKRAIQVKKPGIMKIKKLYALDCLTSGGDITSQPMVINTSGKILPIGTKIQWKATMSNRTFNNGIYTLTKPLYAGQSRRVPVTLHWNFTCKASVFV